MPLAWMLALALLGDPPPAGLRFPDADAADPAAPDRLSKEDAAKLAAKRHAVAGAAHLKNQRLSKALAEFRRALALNAALLPVLRDAAVLAQELERNDEALDYALRALALDGTDADMLVAAGRLLGAKGAAADAAVQLRKATKLLGLAERDLGLYVEARELLADAARRLQRPAEEAEALRELLAVVENPQRYGLEPGAVRQLAGAKPGLALRMVGALRRAGDVSAALRAIAEFGAGDPPLALVFRDQQVELLLARGDPAAARKALERRFADELPNARDPLLLLRKAYEAEGNLPGYDAALARLAEKYPNGAVLRQEAAERKFEQGKFEEAQKLLDAGGGTSSVGGLAVYVRICWRRNRPAEGYAALKKLLGAEAAEQRRDFGGGRGEPGDGDKLRKELAQDKAFAGALARVAATTPAADVREEEARALGAAALVAYEAGAYREAGPAFQKLLEAHAGDPEQIAEYLLLSFQLSDQPQAVLEAAAKLPDGVRDLWYVLRLRAFALGKLGKFAAGEKLLVDAQARAPSDELTLALGDFYRQERKHDEALKALRSLAEGSAGPLALRARYEIAGIHSQRKRDDLAEVELLKIIDAKGAGNARILAGANNDLGYLWADAGKNLDRAEQMIRAALDSDPDNAAYLDSIGWVLFKRGKNAEALGYLKQAATAKGADDPTLWDHYGDALLKAGDRAAAAAAWAKSAELYRTPAHAAEKDKAGPVQAKSAALQRREADAAAPAAKHP